MEHVLSSAAIRERRALLNKQIADAQSQLADLDIAERFLERFGQPVAAARPSRSEMDDLLERGGIAAEPIFQPTMGSGKSMTTKALFAVVLRESPERWLTANDIQERASAIKGQEVPMATVSPTLSNMKNEGTIVRDGLKVALASRLNENGAGSTPAPETALDAQNKEDTEC